MKAEQKETSTKYVPTRSTYTTDCNRRVKDEETGVESVKRCIEERQVTVSLQVADGRVFHNGARIA
jgi:hypothetical protein